jgi:hypothetical protein
MQTGSDLTPWALANFFLLFLSMEKSITKLSVYKNKNRIFTFEAGGLPGSLRPAQANSLRLPSQK